MLLKMRGAVLLVIMVGLMLVTNIELLATVLEEWRETDKTHNLKYKDIVQKHGFDRQRVVIDSLQHEFENTSIYFQKIRLGDIDFATYKQTNIKVEDGDIAENASESS